MDGITCGALAGELDRTLRGALSDRILMAGWNTLALQLYDSEKGRMILLLDADPSHPSFQLLSSMRETAINPPPPFVMLLRKYLRRARLESVSSPPGERMLSFCFSAIDETGDIRSLTLHFECMPRTANIILVNQNNTILDAVRHIDHRVNREREILPAHPYLPPPSQKRPSAETCLSMQSGTLFDHAVRGWSVSETVMFSVAGFSPLLGTEAAYRAALSPDRPFASLDPMERGRLEDAARALCRLIISDQYCPRVYAAEADTNGVRTLTAVHALPLTHLPCFTSFPTVAGAVTAFSRRISAQDIFNRKKRSLEHRLRDKIRHTQKKRELHELDIKQGAAADSEQLKGELILANIYRIPPGADRVSLENYHDEAGSNVIVTLNPKRSAADSAEQYFRRARRNRRKTAAAEKLLREDIERLNWLTSLETAVKRAENEDDLTAAERELLLETASADPPRRQESPSLATDAFPGRPGRRARRKEKAYRNAGNKTGRRRQSREPAPVPPRKFISSDGITILAGRNNLQNESLLRKARKDDLWLHIKDGAGSHVIIAGEGREIPEKTLAEAAGIAAWYSGANRAGGAKTEIDCCRVRDVRKPPHSKPGHVLYSNYRTILTEPVHPGMLSQNEEKENAPEDRFP